MNTSDDDIFRRNGKEIGVEAAGHLEPVDCSIGAWVHAGQYAQGAMPGVTPTLVFVPIWALLYNVCAHTSE